LEASPQRDARDAERGGGPLAVPPVRLEHVEDTTPLVDHEPARGAALAAEEVFEAGSRRAGENQQRFERVLELAHVAGPGMGGERAQRRGTRRGEGGGVRAVEAGDEVLDEQREGLPPPPEGREPERGARPPARKGGPQA